MIPNHSSSRVQMCWRAQPWAYKGIWVFLLQNGRTSLALTLFSFMRNLLGNSGSSPVRCWASPIEVNWHWLQQDMRMLRRWCIRAVSCKFHVPPHTGSTLFYLVYTCLVLFFDLFCFRSILFCTTWYSPTLSLSEFTAVYSLLFT